MHKYVAKQELNGVFVLLKDGNNCSCPKTLALIPVQQNQSVIGGGGGISMQATQFPCSTNCPFAEVKKVRRPGPQTPAPAPPFSRDDSTWEDKDVYEISCEGQVKQIALDEVRLTPQKNGLSKA